jgi:hypothetical protein
MTKTLKARGNSVKVAEAILLAIKAGKGEWSELASELKAQFEVKNWLTEVRGPLQYLINQGQVCRVKDLYKEIYKAI